MWKNIQGSLGEGGARLTLHGAFETQLFKVSVFAHLGPTNQFLLGSCYCSIYGHQYKCYRDPLLLGD